MHVSCEKNYRNKSMDRAHKVYHLGDIKIVITIVKIEGSYYIFIFPKIYMYDRRIMGFKNDKLNIYVSNFVTRMSVI